MNEIINKTGNVIQKIIWGILVAMFGILSIFNILGTTKIDIKVNDYKEYAEYSLNNILMIILYVVTIFAILYIIDRYCNNICYCNWNRIHSYGKGIPYK